MGLLITLLVLLSSLVFLMYSLLFFSFKMSIMIEYKLMVINSLEFKMVMMFDWMSMFFMGIILFISSMVFMFSIEYMKSDIYKNRFFMLVLLFVVSMMMMVLSPNLISILLGWDGLGLVSYCLVIYYSSFTSYNYGMITMLCNRVGDVCFMLIIGLLMCSGTWNLFLYSDMPYMVYILLMGCFLTKSAQMPFSPWLPKAMAAPTPVSSLVHSSTLVTAGVYLMIRHINLIPSFNLMLCISSITMFMAGLNAMIETDLKKIIAYSTLSQLGFMFSILCMNQPMLAFFHLITHALFKSLLFLSAGYLIHMMKNMQNIKSMGMIPNLLPFPSMCLYCSTMSLCGLPFLSGFYSKDFMLETIMMGKMNMLSMILLFMSTIMTVAYSTRLILFMSMKLKVFSVYSIQTSYTMMMSMIPLLIFSMIGGSMFSWMFFDSMDLTFLPLNMKMLVLLMIGLGVLLGTMAYFKSFYNSKLWKFINSMFYTDTILSYTTKLTMNMSKTLFKLDKGWKEFNSSMLFYTLNLMPHNSVKLWTLMTMMMMMIILVLV